MRRQAKGIEHAAVVGIPFGDPACPVTERMGGKDEAHGGGTGGEHLFPFRDFHMGAGAAHHGDHKWCAHETLALDFDMFRLCVLILGAKCSGYRSAGRTPRLTFEDDETPRCKLAVIGYP